ncbi:ead/Ea22-like family protein [Enterobacter hormaechei]|uniref:ead/Ea22-like family protein n=1 Tax=Enterobacter hormaechei TaxID=158836 RepID=UPI0012B8C5CC
MSNIDKRALREAVERAGQNDWEYVYTSDLSAPGRGYITVGGAEAIYCLNKAAGGVKQSENILRYIAAASPETMLALLDELEAKDAKIANLTAERDALREGAMGDAKHSNTRAAADIYFQLVEECEIPAGGSLVEYISDLRERAAAGKGE